MNIITKLEIENMLETLHPVVDESNCLTMEDKALSKLLKYYLFLQQYAQEIIGHSSFTSDEILYSQYYWFVRFKNQYFAKVAYDAGIEQQAFLLIEKLTNELEAAADWDLIEELDGGL